MPSLLASDGSAFVDQLQYYGVGVAAKNRFNVSVTTSYSNMVYSLVEGEGCAAGGASHGQPGGWLRVRVEIMGWQHKCGIVGKSQPVLIMIDPIIFTRTRALLACVGLPACSY
eukprot:COSAG01_NODE_7029_length_3384_cov_2.727245_3_plen_113_part_00